MQISANAKLENDTSWLKKPNPALCFSVCPFCLHHRPGNNCPHTKKSKYAVKVSGQSKGRKSGNIRQSTEPLPRSNVMSGSTDGHSRPVGGELPKKGWSELPRTPLWFWTQNSLAQHCWQCLRCEATWKQQLSVLKLNYFPDIFPIKSFGGIHVSLCLLS